MLLTAQEALREEGVTQVAQHVALMRKKRREVSHSEHMKRKKRGRLVKWKRGGTVG